MGLRCWTLTSSSTCCQWCSLDKCFWTSNSFLCSSLRNSDTSWSEKKKIHSREERNVLTNEQKQILCHPWRCFTNAGQVKKGNASELWIIRHIFFKLSKLTEVFKHYILFCFLYIYDNKCWDTSKSEQKPTRTYTAGNAVGMLQTTKKNENSSHCNNSPLSPPALVSAQITEAFSVRRSTLSVEPRPGTFVCTGPHLQSTDKKISKYKLQYKIN